MEELGVPRHLREVVHRMYEEVKVKIRTSAGISGSFRSDIKHSGRSCRLQIPQN
jgi:hypothetical protein